MDKAKEFTDLLIKLYEQWHNEPTVDCLKAIRELMPTAFRMTKVPFGVFYHDTEDTLFYSYVKIADGQLVVETEHTGKK
jgi:hypothetical protein